MPAVDQLKALIDTMKQRGAPDMAVQQLAQLADMATQGAIPPEMVEELVSGLAMQLRATGPGGVDGPPAHPRRRMMGANGRGLPPPGIGGPAPATASAPAPAPAPAPPAPAASEAVKAASSAADDAAVIAFRAEHLADEAAASAGAQRELADAVKLVQCAARSAKAASQAATAALALAKSAEANEEAGRDGAVAALEAAKSALKAVAAGADAVKRLAAKPGSSSASWLTACIDLFREPLVAGLDDKLPIPKRFVDELQELVAEHEVFVLPEDRELIDFLTSQAAASLSPGKNADTGIQATIQTEVQAEVKTRTRTEAVVRNNPVTSDRRGARMRWPIQSLIDPDDLLRRGVVYPLKEFSPQGAAPMEVLPTELLLTDNHTVKMHPSDVVRRLKNVEVVMEWWPRAPDGSEPLKPRSVVLSLEEAEAVRRAVHMGHPALTSTRVRLTTITGRPLDASGEDAASEDGGAGVPVAAADGAAVSSGDADDGDGDEEAVPTDDAAENAFGTLSSLLPRDDVPPQAVLRRFCALGGQVSVVPPLELVSPEDGFRVPLVANGSTVAVVGGGKAGWPVLAAVARAAAIRSMARCGDVSLSAAAYPGGEPTSYGVLPMHAAVANEPPPADAFVDGEFRPAVAAVEGHMGEAYAKVIGTELPPLLGDAIAQDARTPEQWAPVRQVFDTVLWRAPAAAAAARAEAEAEAGDGDGEAGAGERQARVFMAFASGIQHTLRRLVEVAGADAAPGALAGVTVTAFCWDEAATGDSDEDASAATGEGSTETSAAVARVRQWYDALSEMLPGRDQLSEEQEALDTARQVFKFWNNDIFFTSEQVRRCGVRWLGRGVGAPDVDRTRARRVVVCSCGCAELLRDWLGGVLPARVFPRSHMTPPCFCVSPDGPAAGCPERVRPQGAAEVLQQPAERPPPRPQQRDWHASGQGVPPPHCQAPAQAAGHGGAVPRGCAPEPGQPGRCVQGLRHQQRRLPVACRAGGGASDDGPRGGGGAGTCVRCGPAPHPCVLLLAACGLAAAVPTGTAGPEPWLHAGGHPRAGGHRRLGQQRVP